VNLKLSPKRIKKLCDDAFFEGRRFGSLAKGNTLVCARKNFLTMSASADATASAASTGKEGGGAVDAQQVYRTCGACGKVDDLGSMKVCSKCKLVPYCSSKCQQKAWRGGGHRAVCVAASEKVRPDSTDVRFVNGALRFSADSGSVGRSVTTTCALKSGDLLLYEDACAAITRFHTDDSKTGQVVPMQGVESPHLIAPISNNMSVVEGILSNLTLTKWQMKSILDVTPGAVPDASNVRANARRITCFYGQTDIGVALYRLVPWFRHSCTPNAVFMTTNRHEAVVQLIRDVEKGDEIFVSRIDLPVAQHACSCIRSVELINAGQPACSCNACVREIEAGHVPCPAAKVIDVRKFYFECSISAVRRFSDPHADVFASEKRSASTASANDVLDAWCSDMDEHPDRILRGSHLTFFYFGKMVLMYAPMVTRQLRTEGTPEQKAKCDTFFTRMRRSAQRFEKEPGCLPALSFELARSNVVPGNNFNDVALSITRLMNAVDEGTFALHPDVSSTSVRLASGLGVYYPGLLRVTTSVIAAMRALGEQSKDRDETTLRGIYRATVWPQRCAEFDASSDVDIEILDLAFADAASVVEVHGATKEARADVLKHIQTMSGDFAILWTDNDDDSGIAHAVLHPKATDPPKEYYDARTLMRFIAAHHMPISLETPHGHTPKLSSGGVLTHGILFADDLQTLAEQVSDDNDS